MFGQVSENRLAFMKNRLVSGILVVLILVGGVGGAWWIVTSAPKPARIKPEVKARLVDVAPLPVQARLPVWSAGGVVQAALSLNLQPQISGRIVSINADAVPGAWLKAGTELARIETADYEAVVVQRQAALEQALASLEIERGQGALAAEEYRMTGARLTEADQALVLRKPQRTAAQAAVDSARAALEQARLNLQRTRILMPFDGQIVSRQVAPGAQVSGNSVLFALVGTDEFWIETRVPADFMAILDMEAVVQISHPAWGGSKRQGRILQRLPDVNAADRMVRLLVAVSDPVGRREQQPSLLVNDYVSVELSGRAIAGAVVVPLALIDRANRIWVVNAGQLQQRVLEIAWRGREQAWVTAGLQEGDQLLNSKVDAATEGMPVRIAAAAGEAQP